MKIRTSKKRMLTLYSALAFAALSLPGQEAVKSVPARNDTTPNPTETVPSNDEVLVMDPFTVTTEHEGYMATDTLGGARVRTKLADTPSAISVITPKFMQDLGITNGEDLFRYTTNTEVAGLNGNFSGATSRGFGAVGAAEDARLASPVSINRSRGLTAMDSTRNYFVSYIPGDSFNISRWEIARGPNSFLFGVGSPSGINNVTTNEAVYKNLGSIESKVGSFGTHRESIDYNRVLIPGELAIRVDAVNDDKQFQQKPAYSHSKRIYAAVRFDPKALDTGWAHTKIQANVEQGKIDSNNPRTVAPLDYISGYFQGTSKAGYNPFTYVATAGGPNNYSADASPWVTNADLMHVAWGNSPTFWYDANSGNQLRASQSGVGGTNAPGGLTNGNSNVYHIFTSGFSQFAKAQDFAYPGSFPGASARTVTYIDKTLSDTSIFDFYNKLIDGPNKREWQDWKSFNVNVVQSLFDNRLVLQAVVDHQEYNRGNEGLMSSYLSPYISVDMDQYLLTYGNWLPQAQANPNVGRPFIGGDMGGGGNKSANYISNNYQLTAAYSLKFEELLGKSPLAKILGHHEFTGLASRYSTLSDLRTWDLYAMDTNYVQQAPATQSNYQISSRLISWVAYLGPSLQNRNSPAGLNLQGLINPLVPTSGPITVWNNTWRPQTNTDVTPNRPYIQTDAWTNPGSTASDTQVNNPSNYAGYVQVPATVLNSKANRDQLYRTGSKAESRVTSSAFMYQGYFWDDTIIPSIGFRQDKVRQRGNLAPLNPDTQVANQGYSLLDPGVTIDTHSTSYGITVHLPKAIKKNLPEGTDLTLFYFHGENETPKVRYSFDGTMLPNEKGRTNDYGVRLDGFNGRASLKFTVFKTEDNNAQVSGSSPLGSSSWLLDSLPQWTVGFASSAILAAHGTPNPANSWMWGWADNSSGTNPTGQALALSIENAIQTEFPKLFPQAFWDQYGIPANVAAIQAGDWNNVSTNGLGPFLVFYPNSHLIHGTSPILDSNTVSKGFEIEGNVQPLKGWDITFNASKVTATETSLGATADRYLNAMARIMLTTPVGLTPMWGNINSPVRNEFMSGLWSPYITQLSLIGSDQPEVRKWNLKVISNYTFSKGPVKGLNVGGAYRWADKPILGYGVKQATVFGNTAWISDVNQPRYGEVDQHLDLWVGYQRKLSEKLDWRVQLNLRNVGERSHLTPISVEPDGTWAQQRIVEGMTFEVSNKFMF